jgi:hypothetical protein
VEGDGDKPFLVGILATDRPINAEKSGSAAATQVMFTTVVASHTLPIALSSSGMFCGRPRCWGWNGVAC